MITDSFKVKSLLGRPFPIRILTIYNIDFIYFKSSNQHTNYKFVGLQQSDGNNSICGIGVVE